MGYKYRPNKGGKKSKNIIFETSDQFTQSGLTESRKVEWAKWKQFNAVYPVSGPELEQLLVQGHKPIPLHVAPLFVARVPKHGTCDAGCGFWKKLRHDILSTGLKENAVIRALYIYQEDGEPKLMLATHVDDMLWATKPGYEDRVQ